MMSLIRKVLGGVILFLDRAFSPKPLQRTPELQLQVEAELKNLALYQFEACPFCVKVRRAMKRLNLPIELRDARKHIAFGEELSREGGMLQVPCLRIASPEGKAQWMYESTEIIEYLEKWAGKFAQRN